MTLVVLFFHFWTTVLLACNRGGPMGLASKDPGMFFVNITFSPTFAGASTSGTSGCKKWNFTAKVRHEFIERNWTLLREEGSRGQGEHLMVFSEVMGCGDEDRKPFGEMLKNNYHIFYSKQPKETSESENLNVFKNDAEYFLKEVQVLIHENQNLQCTG